MTDQQAPRSTADRILMTVGYVLSFGGMALAIYSKLVNPNPTGLTIGIVAVVASTALFLVAFRLRTNGGKLL